MLCCVVLCVCVCVCVCVFESVCVCVCCVCVCRREFASHGLADVVTLELRDVCRDGFGKENIADAGIYMCSIQSTTVYLQ